MTELFVAEGGRDSNPGTRRSPLRSPAGARDLIRRLRAEGRAGGPVTVHIGRGAYPLGRELAFGPRDGHVTYRGEKGAVIDGGVRVTRWRETRIRGARAWVADLPGVRAGRWDFRQFFVNGTRRPRARLPKFGCSGRGIGRVFRIAEMRQPEGGGPPGFLDGDFRFRPAPGDMQDWPSLPDAEIVVLHLWTEERLPQPRFHSRTGWVECARRTVFRLNETHGETLARYYIDNLFEALTEPGEWYLERHRGRLFYLPLRGETPDATEGIAPGVCAFVKAEGVPFNREKRWGDLHGVTPVRNLRFEGLEFRHADWRQPGAHLLFHDAAPEPERPLASAPQAALQVPGAIAFHAAEDCAVKDCAIERIGVYGVEIGPGCRRIEIGGNRLSDLGAGGVKLHGGELDEAPWRRTGHCSVCDNTVERGGRVFHSAVGILLGNTFENIVAHNRIRDLFYSGISVGWSWGYRETVSRDNLVLCNRVEAIGQGLLSDMGAIYTLGVQPGTAILGNRLGGVLAHDYGSWGLYLDEGSSHMVVEQNLVHGTQGPCFTLHYGRENILRHNVFLAGPGGAASIVRADGFRSVHADHNLFVSPGGLLFQGGYGASPEEGCFSDTNWIVHARGKRPHCANPPETGRRNLDWERWLDCGNDRFSTVLALPARDLPATPAEALAFLRGRAEASAFGLSRPLWTKAGPRPRARREPLWQPLWRRG